MLQLFDDALASPLNFFFDQVGSAEYLRAPFPAIQEYLDLPEAQFGTWNMWKPYMEAASGGAGVEDDLNAYNQEATHDPAHNITASGWHYWKLWHFLETAASRKCW